MLNNLITLTRPLNVIIASISTLIGCTLSVMFDYQLQVIYAILSVAFITASANIINDIFDVEIDKINKPDRPLASGKIKISNAWSLYYVLNLIGLLFSLCVNLKVTGIALIAISLLYLYSYYFKRTILLGNILVSFVSGLTFVYATLSIGDWQAGIVPGIFALLFHAGREIIKDMQDIEGDLAQQVVTFAGRYGKKRSALLINIVFLVLSIFLVSPDVLIHYNVYYIYIVVSGVISVLMFVSILIWFKNDSRWLGRLSLLLKIDMFIGLFAIYAGVNFPT